MKIEIIKIGVTNNGKDIAIGEQRETDEASGNSLIADGYAKEIKETVAKKALEPPITDLTPAGDKLPAGGADAQTGSKQDGQAVITDGTDIDAGNTLTEEELEKQKRAAADKELAKIKKALDSKYKRDPLYEAALAAGIEIAVDTTKPKIIEAVIAQGMAELLLK